MSCFGISAVARGHDLQLSQVHRSPTSELGLEYRSLQIHIETRPISWHLYHCRSTMSFSHASAVAFLPVFPFCHHGLGISKELYSRTRPLHRSRLTFQSSSFATSTWFHVRATTNVDNGIDDISMEDMGQDAIDSRSSGGSQPPMAASSMSESLPLGDQESNSNAYAAPYRPPIDYELQSGEVGVRFINGPSGSDVIAAAKPGDNLLAVGDSVGVRIPRGCQSGLCGSCTCDLLDTTHAEGRQTVRACQTGVAIPDGGPELVIDVSRMKSFRKEKNPMARFENMDTDYVAGAAPKKFRGSGMSVFPRECSDCNGTGQLVCGDCDGSGADTIHGTDFCRYCLGMSYIRCATCQGTGEVQVRR